MIEEARTSFWRSGLAALLGLAAFVAIMRVLPQGRLQRPSKRQRPPTSWTPIKEEYSWESCCGPCHPVDALTSSLPTVGRRCHRRVIGPKETEP